jgi:hypothetical protein
VADEREDQPEAEASEEQAGESSQEQVGESSQETAVGHSVLEEPAAEPARETAVGHSVVDAEEAAESKEGVTEVSFSRDQPEPAPPSDTGGTSPAAADRQAADARDSFSRKPEVFVAAAFVGAFVVGKLLKRMSGSDG